MDFAKRGRDEDNSAENPYQEKKDEKRIKNENDDKPAENEGKFEDIENDETVRKAIEEIKKDEDVEKIVVDQTKTTTVETQLTWWRKNIEQAKLIKKYQPRIVKPDPNPNPIKPEKDVKEQEKKEESGKVVTNWDQLGKTFSDYLPPLSATDRAFLNAPVELQRMSPSKRGAVFQQLGRQIYAKYKNITTTDSVDYHHKGSWQTRQDWCVKGPNGELIRVECKSARLAYLIHRTKNNLWSLTFSSVKKPYFDECVLIGYFPDRLMMWIWDKKTGYTTNGKDTDVAAGGNGGLINISNGKNKSWQNWTKHPGQLIATLYFPVDNLYL